MVRRSANKSGPEENVQTPSVKPKTSDGSNTPPAKLAINLHKATVNDKLDFLCTQMAQLTSDVELLKRENVEEKKNRKIQSLESRIMELEQYSRRDDIVITGIETPKSSYAKIIRNSSEQQNEDTHDAVTDTIENKIIQELNDKGIPIQSNDISICRTIGKKDPERS